MLERRKKRELENSEIKNSGKKERKTKENVFDYLYEEAKDRREKKRSASETGNP